MYAAADPLPDLTVSGVQVQPGANSTQQVSALVTNKGTATATGAGTRFTDTAGSSTSMIGDATAVTLAPGASTRVTVTWQKAKTGTHTVTAVVDPVNTIRESQVGNNKASTTLTIR